MTQQEFEARAKVTVTADQYARIERIYMAAPNVDKDQFCYEYKKHKLTESETVCDMAEVNEKLVLRNQNLLHDLEMEREIKSLRISELEAAQKQIADLEAERNKLIADKVNLALALLEAGFDEKAIEILGHAYVVSLKCSVDMELSRADRVFIAETFSK